MPRANRVMLDGQICHVTHRCHDRAFLFRFKRDRNLYRKLLRANLGEFRISMLAYCITCNHVHLLLRAPSSGAIGGFMQRVEGAMGQAYNLRKRRKGAFWSDRYHATLVEAGHHLWSCLRYIDLNMVRAGAVEHPREWPWATWAELTGGRRRHRLVDRSALLTATGAPDWYSFLDHYRALIDEAIRVHRVERESWWTEATAVGRLEYVTAIEAELRGEGQRRRFATESAPEGLVVLRETPHTYDELSWAKILDKTHFQRRA